ncbi:MAG: hypothetical protein WC860_08445, partial [Candidatus Margulisiibacteriota bacterium]
MRTNNFKTVFFILYLVLQVLIYCPKIFADFVDYNFKIKFFKDKDCILIQPYAVWNQEIFSSQAKNICLKNGKKIRIKITKEHVLPYGWHGGVPAKSISVWINKIKVIDQDIFDCIPEKGASLEILIDNLGYKKINYDLDKIKEKRKYRNTDYVENYQFPRKIDYVEYPVKNRIP